eukprot:6874706-Pyramimonas_sp.AAC.1
MATRALTCWEYSNLGHPDDLHRSDMAINFSHWLHCELRLLHGQSSCSFSFLALPGLPRVALPPPPPRASGVAPTLINQKGMWPLVRQHHRLIRRHS